MDVTPAAGCFPKQTYRCTLRLPVYSFYGRQWYSPLHPHLPQPGRREWCRTPPAL